MAEHTIDTKVKDVIPTSEICPKKRQILRTFEKATPGWHSHAYRVLKGSRYKAFGCCASVDTQCAACAANRSMNAGGLTHGVFEEQQVKHGVEIASSGKTSPGN